MITFEYKGFDSSGGTQKGLIEALDIKHAREKLASTGILAEKITPAGQGGTRWGLSRGQTFSLDTRTVFYQELVSLIRAGLPLVASLDVLIKSQEMSQVRSLLANVRDKIKEGMPLADALSDASRKVSAYEKAVIGAGERAGVLGVVLERLARFLEEQNQMRERIITALIYPAIVIIVAVGIAVGLLGFSVPQLGQLLQQETNVTLPLLTRVMIHLGSFIAVWGLPILLVILAGAVIAWRFIRRDPARIRVIDQQLFRVPVLGQGYTLLVNLRFARTLSLLLHGGVSLIDGMKLAGESTGSSWVSHLLINEADSVTHGASLANALMKIPPLAGSLAGWIQVGETSGELDRLLESASDRFQQQWNRFLSRLMAMLEPALIIMIGGFVLLVVLSILLPIMSLNQSLM